MLPDGIEIHGWRIQAVKAPMIGDKQLDAYQQALGARTLPEVVFGNSRVTLTHVGSGTVLCFTALDALRGWVEEGLPPLQLQVAEQWQRAREAEIKQQQAIMLQYDWTFTSRYAGSAAQGSASQAAAAAATAAPPSPPPAAPSPAASQPPSTATEAGSPTAAAAAAPLHTTSADRLGWQPTGEAIDRALLMERDPILFYDEVPLYESDLDDNGACHMTVRLRVMPKCWLVLLRFWLRVDGMVVRLRDTRLFCRLDRPGSASRVLREVKHHEGTMAELQALGAPGSSAGYGDAEATAAVFAVLEPRGLKLRRMEQVQLSSSS